MQARARTVGRGGALFRGTFGIRKLGEKLRLGDKLRLGHRVRLETATPPPSVLLQAAPAQPLSPVTCSELEHARSEIARQTVLLADLMVQAEKARTEARALARSRTQLLVALNHDLRTPLNAVIGFSDVMQRELFGPLGHDRYRDYAGHIRASGEQLLRATEQLLVQSAQTLD